MSNDIHGSSVPIHITPQWALIRQSWTKNGQSSRRVDTSMTNGCWPLSKLPAEIVAKLENCFIHKGNKPGSAVDSFVMNKIVML